MMCNNKFYLLFLLLFGYNASYSQQKNHPKLSYYPSVDNGNFFFELDAEHCTVGFTIKHLGWSKVRGSFTNFQGAVVYDKNDLNHLSTSFLIDINSIQTNNNWRNEAMQEPKWFNAKEYPYILFQSKKTSLTKGGFEMIGNISIKGITKEITLLMEPPSGFFKSYLGHQLAFNGKVVINRKDFTIGEETWWNDIIDGVSQLGEEVEIELSIVYNLNSAEHIRSRFFPNEEKILKAIDSIGIQGAISEFKNQQLEYAINKEEQENEENVIDAENLNSVAAFLIRSGKFKEAELLYIHNIQEFPDNEDAFLPLALLKLTQENKKDAKYFANKVLNLNPFNVVALELLRNL